MSDGTELPDIYQLHKDTIYVMVYDADCTSRSEMARALSGFTEQGLKVWAIRGVGNKVKFMEVWDFLKWWVKSVMITR